MSVPIQDLMIQGPHKHNDVIIVGVFYHALGEWYDPVTPHVCEFFRVVLMCIVWPYCFYYRYYFVPSSMCFRFIINFYGENVSFQHLFLKFTFFLFFLSILPLTLTDGKMSPFENPFENMCVPFPFFFKVLYSYKTMKVHVFNNICFIH